MRRTASPPRSQCPISLALELLGDPWSLLIVRDLMFKRFQTFQQFAASGEGIASNILTDRLGRLEAGGILTKRPDPGDARRFVYRLTTKGIDLAPALVELVLWSERYNETDAPPEVIRAMKQDRKGFLDQVRQQWRKPQAATGRE